MKGNQEMTNFRKFLKKININLDAIPVNEKVNECDEKTEKETNERILFKSNYTIENFHFYIVTFKVLDINVIVNLPKNLSLPKKYTYNTTMMIEFKDGNRIYTLSDIFYTKSETEQKSKKEYEKLNNVFKETEDLEKIFKKLIQML